MFQTFLIHTTDKSLINTLIHFLNGDALVMYLTTFICYRSSLLPFFKTIPSFRIRCSFISSHYFLYGTNMSLIWAFTVTVSWLSALVLLWGLHPMLTGESTTNLLLGLDIEKFFVWSMWYSDCRKQGRRQYWFPFFIAKYSLVYCPVAVDQ